MSFLISGINCIIIIAVKKLSLDGKDNDMKDYEFIELSKNQKKLKRVISLMPDYIKARCIVKNITAKSTLLHKDEILKYVYLHYKGEFRIINEFQNGSIFSFSKTYPLSFIGQLEAVSGKQKCAATVEAITDCSVLQIHREHFVRWLEDSHDFLLIVSRILAHEMYRTSAENGEFLFRSGISKLKLYLVKYYKQNSKYKDKLKVQKTRQQIADEIGISTKTVNRNVKKLKEKGFISVEKGKIKINKIQYQQLAQDFTLWE